MSAWVVILAVGLGSYALRAFPVMLGDHWPQSPATERTIARAGTAALAALVVTGLRREATGSTDTIAVAAAGVAALCGAVRRWPLLRVLLVGAGAHTVVAGALHLAAI